MKALKLEYFVERSTKLAIQKIFFFLQYAKLRPLTKVSVEQSEFCSVFSK